MQVNGNFFWMQNWAQQSKNVPVNPLLKQVQNTVAQQGDTKTSDAVSKEMEAKLFQLKKESKIDPADRAPGSAKEALMFVEQEFYGALFDARLDLRDLVDKQEEFTNILNGNADYGRAVRSGAIAYEDRKQFEFTNFETYLQEKGYQGDATKPVDILTTEWITAKDSMGMNVAMLPGQVLVKDANGGPFDQVIYEDQVPLYEQWQADKQAFEAAALKEYAAEKLPQVQKSIEDFPKRINQIVMAFALKRAAIIEKLPEGTLKDEYLENMKAISGLAKEMKDIKPGDGKELLNLLNQMMDRQRENTVSLGGVANNGFERPEFGRLRDAVYYA